MKRLRDTEPDSPLSAQARTLLESVEPLAEDEARLQRVRRALDAAERQGGVLGVRRWPALGLAAAIGLFGATAFAAVAFVAQWRADEPVQAPALQEQTPVKAARRAPGVAATDEPEAAAEQGEPTAETPERTAGESDKARRRPVARGERRPSEREPEQEAAEQPADSADAADSPHSALVHEALQALRHQHDPARAARLLQSYATLTPHGPLAEEALSLRIEALQALGDARARALATQYLQRYPGGRYAAVARRALASADPAP